MFKHIIGQAVFQLIVMLILIFLGDKFIPEYPGRYDEIYFKDHPEYKYTREHTVRSGRMIHLNGEMDYSPIF